MVSALTLICLSCVWIDDADWEARIDLDGDGLANDEDCEPLDPDVTRREFFADQDGDGFGGLGGGLLACEAPSGYAADDSDCDDTDPGVFPGAEELCDGIDQDCDGMIDDAEPGNPWYRSEVCRLSLEEADAVFIGEEPDDQVGGALAGALDLDDDGLGDVALGASSWGEDEGRLYVFYGPIASGELPLGQAALIVTGSPDSRSARQLGVGDLDGDGHEDLAVSALREDYLGRAEGSIYIISGGERLEGTGNLAESATARVVGAESWDRLGWGLAVLGGAIDGPADLLVSSIYAGDGDGVVYRLEGPLEGVIGVEDANLQVRGEVPGGGLGDTLQGLGDLDGDGLADFGLADAQEDRVWVFSTPVSGLISTAEADRSWQGPTDSYTGQNLAAADLDGDGQAELLVGAGEHSEGGSGAGLVYLLPSDAVSGELEALALARFVGEGPGDNAGGSLAAGRDVDGDGAAELLIGAKTLGTNDRGGAYLFFGRDFAGTVSVVEADARFEGASGDLVGTDLALLQDVDGLGWSELLIGASQASLGGSGAGAAWLVRADLSGD